MKQLGNRPRGQLCWDRRSTRQPRRLTNLILALPLLSILAAVDVRAQVGVPTVDANGVKSYSVTSVFQGSQPLVVRVLEPNNPVPGRPRRFLYVLPVEAGVTNLSSNWSDGLEELRLLDVPNRFNLTLIAPSFNYEPWYGDNVTDATHRMESFIIQDLLPFGDSFVPAGVTPQRFVLGFSKSGNGALFLIFRHPNVFSAAAAWDAPTQLNNMSAFSALPLNFGTEANFDQYEIPNLVANNAAPFLQQNRLWISGDTAAWTADMIQLHNQMTAVGIPHTWVQGTVRQHSWNSGWLDGAVTALDASATIIRSNGQPVGVLPAGTVQTTISLTTDQNATCRYAAVAGVAYGAMPNTFTTTGGTTHSTLVTGLVNGNGYTFYVRCQDSGGNANQDDFSITFSVAQPGDTTPPVRSNGMPSGALAAGTTQTTLGLTTNENATCRYATSAGVAYGSMPNTFATTGGTAHFTAVTGLVSGANYAYYVRCQDTAGNANADDFLITFTVAGASTVTSNFTGIESPLSEGGMWDSPGAWSALRKNNGAYTVNLTSQARLVAPLMAADQYSEITYDQDPGQFSWPGVATRTQGPANGSGYLAIAYAGEVRLYRTDDAGSLNFTLLASAGAALGTAPRRLRLESQGNTHRVYFNGVQLITHTATGTVYTSGQPGVAAAIFGGPTIKILSFSGGAITTGADTTPPVRSNGTPTGTLAAGTTQTTLALTTDENATCRYATSAGVAYASMPNTFATTGGTAHSTAIAGLVNGGSYAYYVRCQDTAVNANTNDFTITFTVATTP
jgi:hypothetical protein